MYESSTKETKWVCIQLACSRRPSAFEEAHRWNIQAKFYNENSHLYKKVTKHETLYNEEHGATLKHKCGKKIVAILLFFPFFFFFPFFGPFLAFLPVFSFFAEGLYRFNLSSHGTML